MLQLPDSRGAGALGQPGDFRVKLALTVCSGGHQAAPGGTAGAPVAHTLVSLSLHACTHTLC